MKSYFQQNKHKTNEWCLSFPEKKWNLSKTRYLWSNIPYKGATGASWALRNSSWCTYRKTLRSSWALGTCFTSLSLRTFRTTRTCWTCFTLRCHMRKQLEIILLYKQHFKVTKEEYWVYKRKTIQVLKYFIILKIYFCLPNSPSTTSMWT